MSVEYLMVEVPNNWGGDEDFFTAKGCVRKAFKQIFWQLTPDEKNILVSRVDKKRFGFGGDGIDNAQKATGGRFLSVWDGSESNHIYPRKETFQNMRDNLQFVDEYTNVKLRCFIRNVLDAISKSKRRVILVAL